MKEKRDYTYTDYNEDLKKKATSLRKNMTPQEKRLWYDFLRKQPFNWNKQRPVKNYILDFYCPKAKLVVEIDGSQHCRKEEKIYDEERSKYLRSLGLEILRFSNYEVEKNFIGVCKKIEKTTEIRIKNM